MSPLAGTLLNVAVLAALAVAVFYCMRLSRQFSQMQADRKAFESLIQSLNLASAKADAVIRALKDSAVASAEILQDKIGRAQALSDELEIVIQAGDSLANRLQELAGKSRRSSVADEASSAATEPSGRTRAERDLMEAVRAKQKSEA